MGSMFDQPCSSRLPYPPQTSPGLLMRFRTDRRKDLGEIWGARTEGGKCKP